MVGRAHGEQEASGLGLNDALSAGRGPLRERDVKELNKVRDLRDDEGVVGKDA